MFRHVVNHDPGAATQPGRRPYLAHEVIDDVRAIQAWARRQRDLRDGDLTVQELIMTSPNLPQATMGDRLGQQVPSADQVFGIAWSGGMTEERVMRLLPHLPEGVSEIYFHPAARGSARLGAAMPGYRHGDELAALVSPAVARRIAELDIALKSYRDLAPPR